MNFIQWGKLIFFFLIFSISATAQDTLKLSRQQYEAIFLKENLLLIAEQLQISQAEALVLQAKLWPNPTLSIEDVNLWATQRQLNVFGDELQGFNGGSFGKNQQIAFSIEQLILTAGKRKKLIALEQVSVEKSKQYFENLLRNLKIEFRYNLTQLQHLQLSKGIYENQIISIKQLTRAYKNQVELGNTSKGEYIRLKALELEIAKNISGLNTEINEVQKELKMLMRLPYSTQLIINQEDNYNNPSALQQLTIDELINQSKESNPDYKLAQLEQSYFNKLYTYEKAERMPNLTLKGSYDRGGSFMYNFVGFGLSMDIPVFNRNQGNIRMAKIGMEHAKTLSQQMDLSLENEIAVAYQNLTNALEFFNQIGPDYENTLDQLLERYTKNFTNRNISLLEFLDFFEAYLENKNIILEAEKEVNEKAEELNYVVGKDILNQ
jgi:cobalt-zinc-cadmium efflux system outer membrane protein